MAFFTGVGFLVCVFAVVWMVRTGIKANQNIKQIDQIAMELGMTPSEKYMLIDLDGVLMRKQGEALSRPHQMALALIIKGHGPLHGDDSATANIVTQEWVALTSEPGWAKQVTDTYHTIINL